ncbi:hypothetical protein O181_028348 [Austropuccinia psidii MF-1]|uniref:CMP/dCMP-type deaminase domain-containing protein n=1 Tax=Austropuccinia psidii MF-1 TaxID=1389203 RepID=A0A9Q3H1R0_9BASI|nr:hypothetical protein [Austropuccinia psidii MF-1]
MPNQTGPTSSIDSEESHQSKLVMIDRSKQSLSDLKFMDEAIAMAHEALLSSEIPVGCVLVDSSTQEIIAKGRNRTNETKNACLHAEFDAISYLFSNQEGRRLDWSRIVVYVTVEPCLMCSSALRQMGIRLVYFGCSNDRFGGCGGVVSIHDDPRLIFSHPFKALGGYRREEAIMLLRKFYITENSNAPTPKKKTNRVLKTEIPTIETD